PERDGFPVGCQARGGQMMSFRISVLRWLLAACAVALAYSLFPIAPLLAQSVTAIVGTVTDSTGAALPGVTVTVTGPSLQVPSMVGVSDAKGEFRVSPLPPGTFTVSYELSGFQSVKRDGVRLALGFTATLDQTMGLGTVQETVTVSG